jgi:hypothetical protein
MESKLVPGSLMRDRQPDWKTLERAYAGWSADQLIAELTKINALLATQTRSVVTNQMQPPDLDQPVIRSQTMDAPSRPADLEPLRSRPPQPSALDLLISGQRMGPRLAQKLAMASARARARRG